MQRSVALKQQSLWNIRYIRMCLSNFFQFLTHYILLAAIPVFVIHTLQQSETQAGLTLTFFQVGAVLFRPLAGKWMDVFDKKRVLFLALVFFSLICFMYFGIQTILWLFLLRFLHGAGFSIGTTATATMVAVLSPASRKGEGVGYLAVFTSVAMVIGPFIGLMIITTYSNTLLFTVCTLFGILALLSGNLQSAPLQLVASQHSRNASFSWKTLIEPHAFPLACCGGLLAIAYSSLLAFLPLYANSLGMMGQASYFFAVYALAIVVSRPLIGKLFDQKGANIVIYGSIILYFFGMVELSRVTTPTELLFAGAIIGIGFGGLNPSFQTLAILAAPSHKSGLATSTYFLSMDIGIGVGSLVLSGLASVTNYRVMYMVCSGIVIMIGVLYYVISQRTAKKYM